MDAPPAGVHTPKVSHLLIAGYRVDIGYLKGGFSLVSRDDETHVTVM